MEPEPLREWQCGHCGAQTQDTARPQSSCLQCGVISWGEMLRGEGNFGDAFRPGTGEAA
jgi:hypothetical protein